MTLYVSANSHLKGTCSKYSSTIIQSVLDSSQAVSDSILDLCQGMVSRTLDQDCTGCGIPYILNEGVFVLSKHMLIHLSCKPASRRESQ